VRTRSAGESLGVNVYRHKYVAVMISGALAGLAGAYIVIELSGLYRGGQTLGRGFIGLAALIFGNWRALGILAGSLLFSYPFGLALIDFDATSSGVATRALLLVIAIALFATAVYLWRGDRRHEPPDLDAAALDTPTGSYARMLQQLGGAGGSLTLLAAGLGAGSLLWYLVTDSAASWLPNTMPYVLVLLVLIFAAQHLRPPKAPASRSAAATTEMSGRPTSTRRRLRCASTSPSRSRSCTITSTEVCASPPSWSSPMPSDGRCPRPIPTRSRRGSPQALRRRT
jgi:general nucleoside transport system permease protein